MTVFRGGGSIVSINPYNQNLGGSFLGSSSKIGDPIFTLNSILEANEIWLEGATVSRETYSKLFEVYGTTYGSGDGSTTFALPDFRNRAIWGSNGFGYIEAGLPNITGNISPDSYNESSEASGCFKLVKSSKSAVLNGHATVGAYFTFDASRSSSIYNGSTTVQPPAIKVRVKTRYK